MKKKREEFKIPVGEYLKHYFAQEEKKANNKKNFLWFGFLSIIMGVAAYIFYNLFMFTDEPYVAYFAGIFMFTMSTVSMFITKTCYDNKQVRKKPLTKFGETIILSLLMATILQLVLETIIALTANINNYMLFISNFILAVALVGCICGFMWFINYMLVNLYTKFGEF